MNVFEMWQEFVWTNIQKCVSSNVFRLHVEKSIGLFTFHLYIGITL